MDPASADGASDGMGTAMVDTVVTPTNTTTATMDGGNDCGMGMGMGKSIEPENSMTEEDDDEEGETRAQQKLAHAGFNITNVTKGSKNTDCQTNQYRTSQHINAKHAVHGCWTVTPMTYFCWHQDLLMCRYLYRRGADTTDLQYKYNQGRSTTSTSTTCSLGSDYPILVPSSSGSSMFPMYAAAYRGHTDVCQWLYDHGAAEDIHRKNVHGYTPFQASMKHTPDSVPNQRTNAWFLAHGALSGNTATGNYTNTNTGSLVDECQSLGGGGPLLMTDHGQEYDYTRHRYQHQNQHNLPHPTTKKAGTTTPTRGNKTTLTMTTAATKYTDHDEEEEEDTLMSCVL